jgi:hypothetical protein
MAGITDVTTVAIMRAAPDVAVERINFDFETTPGQPQISCRIYHTPYAVDNGPR